MGEFGSLLEPTQTVASSVRLRVRTCPHPKWGKLRGPACMRRTGAPALAPTSPGRCSQRHWLMGPGVGFLLRLPGEPSLYLSGDTVLTNDVRTALERERPDIANLHAGGAQLDIGSPILMTLDEQLEFVRLAPGRVIAVHLEALDHCGITRATLDEAQTEAGVSDRVDISADGQTIEVPNTDTRPGGRSPRHGSPVATRAMPAPGGSSVCPPPTCTGRREFR